MRSFGHAQHQPAFYVRTLRPLRSAMVDLPGKTTKLFSDTRLASLYLSFTPLGNNISGH
ncbi:hypothetical protein RSAG8_05332, partial [Rhizoctonia solani AG-8 WAC10335]